MTTKDVGKRKHRTGRGTARSTRESILEAASRLDSRARLQPHVARRRAPRERRRQGQLLLPLQEQGRARLRHPRTRSSPGVPRADARALLRRSRARDALAQIRCFLDRVLEAQRERNCVGGCPLGQPRRGAVRRARGIPRAAHASVRGVARAADAGAPRRAGRAGSRDDVPARGGGGLPRRGRWKAQFC